MDESNGYWRVKMQRLRKSVRPKVAVLARHSFGGRDILEEFLEGLMEGVALKIKALLKLYRTLG